MRLTVYGMREGYEDVMTEGGGGGRGRASHQRSTHLQTTELNYEVDL